MMLYVIIGKDGWTSTPMEEEQAHRAASALDRNYDGKHKVVPAEEEDST